MSVAAGNSTTDASRITMPTNGRPSWRANVPSLNGVGAACAPASTPATTVAATRERRKRDVCVCMRQILPQRDALAIVGAAQPDGRPGAPYRRLTFERVPQHERQVPTHRVLQILPRCRIGRRQRDEV